MGSPRKLFSSDLFFLFLLLSSNLLTLFLSTTYLSSSSCSLIPIFTTLTSSNYNHNNDPPAKDNDNDRDHDDNDDDPPRPIPDLPEEFLAFTNGQALPFGHNPNFGSDKMYPPVGSPCTLYPEDLRAFMSYRVNSSCPDDERVAQRLLLRGCEPLPRRRCRPAAAPRGAHPRPFPDCLWKTPPDSSVVWTAYSCKNYTCLVERSRRQKGFDDCKDCFDLAGRESSRWVNAGAGVDFSIDEVLAAGSTTVRIGLDIGGGVATFAVRMRERNVTIVTTTMNLNGPFNSFVASRGVVPLYITISQRLPFFDNTLDIVHSMHVLSNWVPPTLLHFIMFDIYRILRPGGLFWLDRFFCIEDQFKDLYKPLIESVGFHKVKWVVGQKLDRGPERKEMYLSALLRKPIKNSW